MPQDLLELPSSFTIDDLGLLLSIALASVVTFLLVRWMLRSLGGRLITRINPRLATTLEQQKFFSTLALLAPVVVIALARPLLLQRIGWAIAVLDQLIDCYIIIVIALMLYKLLAALETLFTQEPASAAPIRGIFRWLRIGIIAVATLLALGAFTNVQVTWLLAGIGFVAAVGSIVFSDMIYNAVSGFILKGRKLVNMGDWLEIPALQIDGEVKHISSQLIELQNWDNTLATVPPRYLLTNTFRNWQQMVRAGSRRILHYIHLDVTSVRLVDDELAAAASRFPGVATYIEQRRSECTSSQESQSTLTNVALYRSYLMSYLAAHPKVDKENIWRVTSEDSVGRGLPLQILAYVTETQDLPYRLLDSEIYEHAIAVASHFGLRLFQSAIARDGCT